MLPHLQPTGQLPDQPRAIARPCGPVHARERRRFVERPPLVRLEVREPHVAQVLHGQDGGHRLPDEREHPAGPVWKSQWLLVYVRLRRRSQRAVALAMFEYGEVPAALEAETR